MTRTKLRSIVVGTAGGAFLLALVGANSVAIAADHAVDIAGFAFAPQAITVSVGDTVTWSNSDAQHHTATADDGSFDTGTVSSGSPKSVTFSTPGTFAYHCRIHPSMTATVVVEDAATAPATDTEQPTPASTSGTPAGEWLALAIAGLGGAFLARRRFAGSSTGR